MKKGIKLEQSKKAVKWAKAVGLNVRAYFVLGTPGETLETIKSTVDFAKSLPLDLTTFYTLTLYPGNELYQIAKKEGTIIHEDYKEFNPLIDVRKAKLAYVPEGVTEKQLKLAIARAHKDFYIRPSFIFRQFMSIRRFEDIIRYWRGLKTVVRM
jgi:anaerobic magnesium-protoporphyrin IX monomethyl ester cyclase